LLGGFRVSVGSAPIEENAWRLRKAAALVKLLSLAEGHRLHREQAMNLLWPDSGRVAAANNLRQALYVARKALHPDPRFASRYLSSEVESLAMCREGTLWVDVWAFEEASATARSAKEPAAYQAALDLYGGDLLPDDRYEEWTEGRREELRHTWLLLHVELARAYEKLGEYERGIDVLRRAVLEEPSNEKAHVGLMRLYALSGRQGEALTQFERLREALSGQLDAEPDATTQRLREDMAAGRFPPDQPLFPSQPEEQPGVGRHNLPLPRTSFVGRARELVEVKRTLAMTHLLTLTGAGGSGKTRLALEVARDLVGLYPDGVRLVELASLSEGELVPQEVARVLTVREQPGRPLVETLVDTLQEKEILLVLDNCEHLVEAAAQLVDTLLGAAPHLRVLTTSRETLGLAGEVVLPVTSLSLPDLSRPVVVEELEGYDSVRLFRERALSMERALYGSSGFTLAPANTQTVAEICWRLGGIPLAIELAAAWVGTLSVEQISERLDDSLGLLRSASWSAEPKQRTLRSAMDWSYELLSESEQRLFGKLSVFAGGWTLEAAEAVGAGDGIEQEEVLHVLRLLVNKSLVVTEAGTEGTAYYRMLEPMRQYAQEKLEPGKRADEVRRRHAVWFLGLAEEVESGLSGTQREEGLEKLEAEHDNLRVALSWALDREEAELGLRLVAALWWFWYARGYLSEGRRWLEGTLSLNGSATTQPRAWALNGAGWIALFQGEFEAAKTFLEEALALFRKRGDKEGIASTLANLGFVAMLGQREDIPVPALLEEARKLRPGLRNRRTVAYLLLLEGVAAVGRGDLAYAMELHEESLLLLREVRDVQGVGGCLLNMGLVETARADYPRATELLRETLHVAREAGDKNIIQLALFGLASAVALEGEPARAARLWGASEAMREAFDMQLSPMTRSFAGYENNLTTARSQLGEVAFEEAWAEGKAMVQQKAAVYALSEEKTDPATTPVPEEPPTSEPIGKLTRRELEVADFVVRGLTNRQIASQLMLSEHTVATHVRNVLKKLGLRSRTQIATWFREHRPLP